MVGAEGFDFFSCFLKRYALFSSEPMPNISDLVFLSNSHFADISSLGSTPKLEGMGENSMRENKIDSPFFDSLLRVISPSLGNYSPMENLSTSKWLPGYIALGITWGSSFFFIKLALISFTPFGIALLRGVLGGVTLLAFSVATKQDFRIARKTFFDLVIVSMLLNSIPGFLFALAETRVSSIIAGMLNATTPLMTVLMIFLIFKEQKINTNQMIGIFVGFVGIIFVSGILTQTIKASVEGIILLLLATLCYGLAFPFSRRRISNTGYSSTLMATYQVWLSALLLFPFSFVTDVFEDKFQTSAVLGMLALGIFGTGFAYIWNFRNVQLAGSAIASTVTYISPVIATLLGVIFLNETITLGQVFGGALVVMSALLVQNRLKIVRN